MSRDILISKFIEKLEVSQEFDKCIHFDFFHITA
jgi:hypothetical protein